MNSTTPSTLVVCMDDAIITEFLLKRGLLHNIELPKPPRNTTELVTLSDDPKLYIWALRFHGHSNPADNGLLLVTAERSECEPKAFLEAVAELRSGLEISDYSQSEVSFIDIPKPGACDGDS